MSFFHNLIRLFWSNTGRKYPVITSTTITIVFKEEGTRQFIYSKKLEPSEIADTLNIIFSEHEGLEIAGEIEVFRYIKDGDNEAEALDYLPVS